MNPELYETYNENKSSLSNFVYSILRDDQYTEDVMQELWVRLSRQNYDDIKGHIKQWLFTVSRNLSIKVYHKRNRFVELNEDWDSRFVDNFSPDEELEHNEKTSKIKSLLSCLKPNQKKAIMYKYYENLSYEQIGKKMKLSTGNVGFILHNAIKKLKDEFDKVNQDGIYCK